MAKFYGKSSRYLKQSGFKYHLYAFLVIILVLPLFWLISKFATPGVTAAAALIFILFLLILAKPLINLFNGESSKFSHGLEGEEEVRQVLESLDNQYTVFHGAILGKDKGDIDFIVVGPPGIFILEVKSLGGKIGFNGQELTLNGQKFRGNNIIRQVHGEVWALKNYFIQELGKNIYIHPTLVFSHPFAEAEFGYLPVNNVYIVQKEHLLTLFTKFPNFTFPLPRQMVEAALLKIVSNH
jgi:hypothetical protein